jgi:cytoskeletal protein RodZ
MGHQALTVGLSAEMEETHLLVEKEVLYMQGQELMVLSLVVVVVVLAMLEVPVWEETVQVA